MATFCQRVESDRAYVVYKSLSNAPGNTVKTAVALDTVSAQSQSQSHDGLVLPGTLLSDL